MSPTYETRLFIDGELVGAHSGKTFDLLSPITNDILAKVHLASGQDVDAAVKAAGIAQPKWAATPAHVRGEILRKFADLMAENRSKLAELDAVCMGKPIGVGQGDLERACQLTNYYSGLVETAYGQTSLGTPSNLNISLRQPFGVVASIVPWNFPSLMFCHEVPAACGAGNAIILKTSEKSPLSGAFLAQLATKAGFPPGIVNVIHGAGTSGELLSSHMKIRRITFTGSVNAGRAVLQAAARSNLKDVGLELGGKSPLVVFADANLKSAAKLAVKSITMSESFMKSPVWKVVADSTSDSGQVCTASSRAYIQKAAAPAFRELIVAQMAKLKRGSPLDVASEMGPQADQKQAAAVKRYLEIGNQDGKVLTGGAPDTALGPNYIQPTVFTNVADTSAINVQEVFGPVLVLHEFETEEEVIRRANDTEYGLYASVFSSNINTALRVASALEAGNVGVNTSSPYDAYELPFGGYKQSGIGRMKGSNAVMSWLEDKSVYINQEDPEDSDA